MSTVAKKERKPKSTKSPKSAPPKVIKPNAVKSATKPKATRKPKSTAPKRPKSAYIIFLSDQRDTIIKSHPGIVFTDIPKVAAEQWKSLKPTQKTKYEKAAEQDRERYRLEMLNYVPTADDKKARKKKDPAAPKKPSTAFNFYVRERSNKVRATNPGAPTQIMKHIAVEWKGLSERQKEPFYAMAAHDKQRYASQQMN